MSANGIHTSACPRTGRVLDDVLEAIGGTPLIRLNKIPQSEGVKCQVCGLKSLHRNDEPSLKYVTVC